MNEMTQKKPLQAAPSGEKQETIGIRFSWRDFEHDIYELIRAFYPGRTFVSLYDEAAGGEASLQKKRMEAAQDPGSFALFFHVEKEENLCRIRWRQNRPEREGCLEIPLISGIPTKQGQKTETDQQTDRASDLAGYSAVQASDALLSFDRQARKEKKDRIKRALYLLLKELTGRDLPWGNLTGIRPAKLAMAGLEQGMEEETIRRQLQDRYFVSPAKASLAVAIAQREKEILSSIDVSRGYSLYVGIPFCPSICLYCSFSSFPLKQWEDQVEDYLQALFYEMDEVSRMMRDTGRRLDTIYIGGGTPTTLHPDQLRRLLTHLEQTFGFDSLREFTVEAGRPDSITAGKLRALREFPVSRISVNPQTMNQETLDLIGRRHTTEQTEEAFTLAREEGFDNINMDIIIGLPGEDGPMVDHTLEKITALGPDSLTVHTLAVKRAARLNMFRDQYTELTYESSQEIMERTMQAAGAMSMLPYYLYRQKNMKGNFENVGYAKVDKAGIYNILIMEEKQSIVALGASGASKLVVEKENRIERVENVKDVRSYIGRVEEMVQRKRDALPMISLQG